MEYFGHELREEECGALGSPGPFRILLATLPASLAGEGSGEDGERSGVQMLRGMVCAGRAWTDVPRQ